MGMTGELIAININKETGQKKMNTEAGELIKGHGLKGDAHAGDWHRQVSLLALESVQKMQELGLDVQPGDFAENLTIKGIDLVKLPIGTDIYIDETIHLKVTQIGKECHDRCQIYYQAGDCVMPREGIFAEVISGGEVKVGDTVTASL